MDPLEIQTLAGSVLAAVIVGGLSLLGVRSTLRAQERTDQRSRADEADRILRKYRDPLARSAFDLQSRLYNIAANDFLGKYRVRGSQAEQVYAVESTLYVIAEHLGWVEILRREVQFLDLGDIERNRLLTTHLARVAAILMSERPDAAFRIFRAEQRAIGDVMVTVTTGGQRECIGYAEFTRRLQEPAFAAWFQQLRDDVERLAAEPGTPTRVIEVQNALIDLLDFLDPHHQYFPADQLSRLAQPAPVLAPGGAGSGAAASEIGA
jgi:hypothetical protein